MALYRLGEYEFPSKQKAKQYYSDLLKSSILGKPLQGEDLSSVTALLNNHPSVETKIGKGIKYIIPNKADFNTRCFHIERIDGTLENFSMNVCLNGAGNNFTKFSEACRNVVWKDIYTYKINYFKKNENSNKEVSCQDSGEMISFYESHVDHREPMTFSMIVHFFIKAYQIDTSNISYDKKNTYGSVFLNSTLKVDFLSWHNENAILRIIKVSINLKKSRLGQISLLPGDGKLPDKKIIATDGYIEYEGRQIDEHIANFSF